jgi:DNA-binding transcriptional LysR family regulator
VCADASPLRAPSIQEILTLVGTARGVCLVPATVAASYPRADVAYIPVLDAEPAVVSLARSAGRRDPAVEAFVQTARDVAAQAVAAPLAERATAAS